MAIKRFSDTQHIQIDYGLLHSEAWQSLSRSARDFYVQLKARRNLKDSRGKIINRDDDYIKFSHTDSYGMSKPTFRKAADELIKKGFIEIVECGHFPAIRPKYALSEMWRWDDEDDFVMD